MSKQNTFPDYENLNRLLAAQAVALTAAEMHGLLSGILCGGNKNDSWQVLVHELTNDGLVFTQMLAGPLREAIDDLRNIGQLGYDEDEDREELAHRWRK